MEATVAPPMYEHNLQQLLAQIEQLLRQSLTVTSSSELGEALDTLPVTKISNDFPSLNSPKEMSQNSKGSSLCALDTRLTPASPVSHAGSGSSHDVPRSPRGTPLSGGVWRESAGPSKLGSRNVKLFGPSVPDSDMSRPSSGLLRKESPDFEVDDSKMNRQVSWMAEKCRVITDMALEAALEMNSTPGEGFEVHHGLQVLSDESGSPRYSCRPSQSTLDHARYGGGQRQRGPSWVEVWAFFGLVFAYCEAVRVPFLAFRGNSLAFLDVASIGFWSMNLVASFCVSERALTAGAVAFVVLECVLLVSTIWYYQGGQHDAVAAVRSLTILRLIPTSSTLRPEVLLFAALCCGLADELG